MTSAHAAQPPTTAQIHFLHDFVQKTVGLTISGNGKSSSELPRVQSIDLSRFHSLKHLELRSCSFSLTSDSERGIEGLCTLRQQLEVLVLVQVFGTDDLLWEVLADSAVSVGPGLFFFQDFNFFCVCILHSFFK